MTKLAEAISNAVKRTRSRLGKIRTSIVGIAENGISLLGKVFGF